MTGYGRSFALWREAAGAWDDYVRHPFVQGLGDGTLPRDGFLRYLVQDYRFLIHFSRAWALGAAKAGTLAEMRACIATVDALVNGEAQTAYTQMLVNASRQYTREMAREVAAY